MTNQKIRGLLLAALMVTSVFAGTIAFAGAASAANVPDDADVEYSDQNAFYQGQEVIFTGYNVDEQVDVFATDDGDRSVIATQVSADEEGDIVVDTGDLEAGEEYRLEAPSGNAADDIEFSVVQQNFDVNFDDSSVTNGADSTTDLEVTSNNRAGDFTVEVSADGLDEEELLEIFDASGFEATADDEDDEDDIITVTLNKNAENTVDFNDIDEGDYEFNFSVTDTTAEASDTITVEDSGSERASLEDGSLSVTTGDSVDAQVNLRNSDVAYLLVGGEDAGYEALARITEDGADEEDGVVNVTINTYNPNEANNYGLSVDSDDGELELVDDFEYQGVSAALDTGSYDLAVDTDAEEVVDTPDDVGTLSVNERSTGSAQSWTAPGNADALDEPEDLDDEDVLEAVEDGVITQDSDIASQDWAVVQFTETSGIYGYYAENGFDGEGLDFTLEEADPGQNQEPITIRGENNENAIYVVESDETNNLFVLINTGADGLEATQDGETLDEELNSEDLEGEWNATLTIGNEIVDPDDDDEEETVSTEFEVVERTAELDTNNDDQVEVFANENATITGETAIAPGSEITVTIQSESGADNPFVQRQDVNVSDDGTFEAEFNTADLEVGTNFTASLSATPQLESDSTDDYDAVIVEGQPSEETETTTDNGTADTTTATDETPGTDETTTASDGGSTDETDTTPDGTETTTESTSPGFGIAVALVALAGAALLAVRRDN
ncbi:PGF-CTERM protein/surface glycoprotein [Halogranum rubrum]|uniref:PGF-CTERM protein/surface glycoprotein n=1 Tax=Halogranum rubrum TaxID=553466 RepID=A0A1I4EI77_9EURY|nr:BGTF surface domain-containing protein [Halogranum rubrum]SFL05435.1 PGF-CTERM protein/surface glycoprotein [Halogranum rubrum]